jgi:phenylalanine ammonia-lyase
MTIIHIGEQPLSIEQVYAISTAESMVELATAARSRIRQGRAHLEKLLAAGERIYGVNTGVGGNIVFQLGPEQTELLQTNIMRHLSCATGQPLPTAVVRAAMVLRLATFSTGCSGVRLELVDALAALLNRGVIPIVPRYGSVGASGDLMPSAYVARALIGMGEVEYQGRRMTADEGLAAAGLQPISFAPKEGLALINGTTMMTAVAALLWVDTRNVAQAMLAAIALSLEAMEAPSEPYEPWVHAAKGHPGQIAVAAHIRDLLRGSRYVTESRVQTSYSLRCPPQGLGPIWESLDAARSTIEREINSANDNPLIDPETGRLYLAGNFYGGHIARLLDAWKLDFAILGNWGNALMAVLVDDKFNRGLPANLTPEPGVNSGFKGMQLSVTSLACAIRQMAGPSSIHSLPTEQYNQDVVSLGMHAAVTAMDAMECLRDETAMLLLAATQAVDLRGGAEKLGEGTRRVYATVRGLAAFQDRDRPMEREVAALSGIIASSALC